MSETKTCNLSTKKSTSELIRESVYEFGSLFVSINSLAFVLNYFFEFHPLNVYYLVGLLCAIVATYYKLRIALNPEFKTNCNCFSENPSAADVAFSNVIKVLDHKKGSLLFNIPNSVFGIIFYIFMMLLVNTPIQYEKYVVTYIDDHYHDYSHMFLPVEVMKALTIISCTGGLYLWYTMVYEIKSICILCMTVHATNFATLFYLFSN